MLPEKDACYVRLSQAMGTEVQGMQDMLSVVETFDIDYLFNHSQHMASSIRLCSC